MNGQKPPLQFSILRLAIALGVFGLPFKFLANRGVAGVIIASGVGAALAILTLIVRRADQSRILNLLVFAAISGVVWLLLAPHQPYGYSHRRQIGFLEGLAVSVMVGCLAGWLWNLFAIGVERKGE